MAGNGNSFPFFENVTTFRRKILSQQTLENFESPEPLKPAPKPHPVGQCKSCLHRIHLLVGHEPVYKLCSLEPPEIKQSFDHCVSLERHANSKLYQICKCVFDKHGRTLMSAHTSRKRESFLSHTLYAYHMCSFQIVPCKKLNLLNLWCNHTAWQNAPRIHKVYHPPTHHTCASTWPGKSWKSTLETIHQMAQYLSCFTGRKADVKPHDITLCWMFNPSLGDPMAKLGPTCFPRGSHAIGNTDVDCYLTCRFSKQQPPCSPKWTASVLHFESWLFLPRSVWIERNGNAITSRYRWEEGLLFWGSLVDIIEIVGRPQLSQPLVCNTRQSYLYLCQAKPHLSVSHAQSLQAVKIV